MTKAEIDRLRALVNELESEALGYCPFTQASINIGLVAAEARALLNRQQPTDFAALDRAYPTQARDAGA